MFKPTVIFFVLLVTLSVSSSLQIPSMDAIMIPSDLSRDSLLQLLVEMQTTNVYNSSQFFDKLQEMLNNLNKSQEKHKQVFLKMNKEYKEHDSFRAKEVAAAKSSKIKSLAQLQKCKTSLKAAKKSLPIFQENFKNHDAEKNRAVTARRQEKAKYMKRTQAFKEAIIFVKDFMDFLKKKIKSHFDAKVLVEMSNDLIKHASRVGIMSSATPVLVAIASSGVTHTNYNFKDNKSISTKVMDLLKELLRRLQKDTKADDEEEKKLVKIFNIYFAKLNEILKSLSKNIKKIQAHFIDMENCISTETKISSAAISKLRRNQLLKDQATKMLKDFNKEYKEATLNRLDEIKTMNDIIKIVKKRFKNFPKGLDTYIKNLKGNMQEYVNSTPFKKLEDELATKEKDKKVKKDKSDAKSDETIKKDVKKEVKKMEDKATIATKKAEIEKDTPKEVKNEIKAENKEVKKLKSKL